MKQKKYLGKYDPALSRSIQPDDGLDPRFDSRRSPLSRKRVDRKAAQLCAQVRRALEFVVPEALVGSKFDALVLDVQPAPNTGHLLINSIVLNAFKKALPGANGDLVYFISHNIARRELLDGQLQWVHRKGATRALPAGHRELAGTAFERTGHPILLPGNPRDGSCVMVAKPGASLTAFSVNHGAGRRMSRTVAKRTLVQKEVERSLSECDVISNCRRYPIDEAPDAYKDFSEVVRSVEAAGLATRVAKLFAKFVIKDASS